MRRIHLLPLCVVLLAACVNIQSLDNAVPDNAAVMDQRLLGSWAARDESGKPLSAVVVPFGARGYHITYVDEHGDTSRSIGRLGRLDNRFLLDLVATDEGRTAVEKLNGVAMHGQLLLEINDSTIGVTAFDGDTLKRALTSRQAPYLGYVIRPGGDVLLTDSSARLNRGLAQYARRPHVEASGVVFRRVAGTVMGPNGPRAGVARILGDETLRGTSDTATSGHSDFDVEVIRWRMADKPSLFFALYRRHEGVLRRFMPFAAEDSTSFAAASYAWTNDSTVVIRLQDAGGRSVAAYQITGYQDRGNIMRLRN